MPWALMGAGVPDHADQQALYDLIQQNDKSLTDGQIAELIRLNGRTSTITENTGDQEPGSLFCAEEMTRSPDNSGDFASPPSASPIVVLSGWRTFEPSQHKNRFTGPCSS